MASLAVWTMNMVPLSAFSGRPPSDGGLNRGSRQVPVQVGRRIGLGVVGGLLVADEGAVRRVGAVDGRLPPGLPEDLVAGEERQVHPGVAGRLDVGPLGARPVLVVADRQERLVVQQQATRSDRCRCLGLVADVVAVRLEEADHRVLGRHRGSPAVGCAGAGGERAVVAHLGGPARRRRRRGWCRPSRCRPPRWCPRSGRSSAEWLDVVAHHERDLVVVGVVVADQMGDVHARDGGGRHGPRRRHRPVAAVDQAGRGVGQAGGWLWGSVADGVTVAD